MSEDNRKGLKVSECQDVFLIDKMLLTGWSPKKIEIWLRDKYPDDSTKWISEHTLLDYRKNFLALNASLPPSYYEDRIKHIDVAIDTLQELYTLIEQQKRRLDPNLKIEDDKKISLPDTRKEMELLSNMIVQAIELEIRLGIRKAVPEQIEIKQLSLEALLVKYLDNKQEKPIVDLQSPAEVESST